jgi:hypothetical protein
MQLFRDKYHSPLLPRKLAANVAARSPLELLGRVKAMFRARLAIVVDFDLAGDSPYFFSRCHHCTGQTLSGDPRVRCTAPQVVSHRAEHSDDTLRSPGWRKA